MAPEVIDHIPGEKHYYAYDMADEPEIDNGETLTGTPTVTFNDLTGLTITGETVSGTQVRFWLESSPSAAVGLRAVTVTVSTSGGATLKGRGNLRIANI